MSTPDLPRPDLEDVDYELWGQNVKADCWFAAKMRAYGDARAAAAVLAEQEKAEAMRTKAQELVDALDGSYWSSWQTTAGFSAQWEALRAAIRAEPKEQQP